MALGVKKSCTSCQQRHVKCNSVHPTCGPCTGSGRVCHWAGVFSFRHDLNPSVQAGTIGGSEGFGDAQKWVATPRELHFVDETRATQLTYTESWPGDSPEQDAKDDGMSPLTKPQMPYIGYGSDLINTTRDGVSPQTPPPEVSLSSPRPPQPPTGLGIDSYQTVSPNKALLPLKKQKAEYGGLQDEQQVRLVRYFIEKLSPWFDLCDLEKHFATVAPRRALTCPMLLNAICAASARQLSRTTDFDPLIADHFSQLCLSTLIPALHDPDFLKDENLFAAVVILRLFEEFEGSHNLNHMLGIQVLLDAQDYTEAESGLGLTAFHVALRQEVSMAFTHQRPVLAKLMEGNTTLSLSPACERVWAYRSCIYFAVALEFCYGSQVRTLERWQELVEYHRMWIELRPDVFDPIHLAPSGIAGFPTVCYLDDIHVTTANHYTLGRLLLVAHDPRISTTIERERPDELVREEIEYHIRQLCGTALSNPQVPVAMVSASTAIAKFGHRFSEHETQISLLDTLIRTEKQHGWPTTAARKRLMETWGWKQ